MRPEEVTADIPEEDVEETLPEEDAASPETVQEESPEETVPEDGSEETDTEETSSEETSAEETAHQEKTAAGKDSIQGRKEALKPSSDEPSAEYPLPASDLEYGDVFGQILAEQQATNALLVRITNQNDLFLGIGVALIICCVCYSVLERFTRF